MPTYTITRICGHTERLEMFGPEEHCKARREWMEATLCPDCYRKKCIEAARSRPPHVHLWRVK